LPHFDGGEIPQSITFRLWDSLPQVVLKRWQLELSREIGIDPESALRKRIEAYLDQGYGSCYLRRPHVATSVQNALLHFDGTRYRLSAWVVMPNHVHILLTPFAGRKLSDIMHSLKSFTAQEANELLNRKGRFWMKESFDRRIRNVEHFAAVVAYIENNPVKAGLCKRPEDWPYSSAWFKARR
jgi:REP element-mobilizing transposase RayT